MPAQLPTFSVRGTPTLQVFCPNQTTVVTAFEDYLPDCDTIHKITDTDPCLPTTPCWLKQGYDYFAFLPKERFFDGHLLASLNNHRPLPIRQNSRWRLDDKTRNLWRSLDVNLTKSITLIGGGMLYDLDHYEPDPAAKYGFSHDHKTEGNLRLSLSMSKRAFVHRLAYLSYLISRRHQWDRDLVSQEWWKQLTGRFPRTWVDSVLDTIHRQRIARNFIGVVVKPTTTSVRWLGGALKFGVPIWVKFPRPGAYDALDGGFVMKQWEPTTEQVNARQEAERSKFAALATPIVSAPLVSQLPTEVPEPEDYPNQPDDPAPQLPASNTLSPPKVLPDNARWYESWRDFFENRERANEQRLEGATEAQKQSWESLAKNAKKFQQPGKRGALVYVWEECDSGGFFRILQTRFETARDWEYYFKEALIFDPHKNTWDHCPFAWTPAIENGSPDDLDEDEDDAMGRWYPEPVIPETLPDCNPEPLEFLYQRYGFLTTQPTAPPTTTLLSTRSRSSPYRIFGLIPDDSGKPPEYLDAFCTSVLQRQLPAGHCDLSSTCPPGETFVGRGLIRDTVLFSQISGLSDEGVFIFFNNPGESTLLAVHDSLSVLHLVRVGTHLDLKTELQFLTQNGCQFQLLYPNVQPLSPPKYYPFTFPLREPKWKPDAEDHRAYMSRLVTFFDERPHAVAAALSRGGIAWRIVLEVIGIRRSVEILMDTCPEQRCSVNTTQGIRWCHELDEGEWFYLVGGYEVLTGKGDQRLDLSWWPKVTTWEASGAYVGFWTPLCERWFRKRLEFLRLGKARPYTSSQWAGNLRYAPETKKFFNNFKNIGRDYLIRECEMTTA